MRKQPFISGRLCVHCCFRKNPGTQGLSGVVWENSNKDKERACRKEGETCLVEEGDNKTYKLEEDDGETIPAF
jgi:hypothetical protein